MFQSALICTDFTDGLYRLTHFVPSLAEAGLRRIVFLHTVPPSEEREIPRPDPEKVQAARDRLSDALSQVPEGVEVKIDVQVGRPTDHILQARKTYQTDVIIVGIPSRSRLNEKLFGSTTMELCKRLTTPILTLRPQLISTYTTEELDLRCRHLFRYLLLAYDGSESAKYLVQRVKYYAEHHPVQSLKQCLACWVVDDAGRRELRSDEELREAQAKIQEVKPILEAANLQVNLEVRKGTPILELLEAAEEYDISAIATSSRTLGKLASWTSPSLTGEILHRSWHPVLYFPPE